MWSSGRPWYLLTRVACSRLARSSPLSFGLSPSAGQLIVLASLASQALVVLSFGLVSRRAGLAALGQYQIVRAIGTVAGPLVMLGLIPALCRHMKLASSTAPLLWASHIVLVASTAVSAVIGGVLYRTALGEYMGTDLLVTALYVFGVAFGMYVAGWQRAMQRGRRFALVLLLSQGFATVISLPALPDIETYIVAQSTIRIVISCPFIVLVSWPGFVEVWSATKTLWRAGPPRLAGDVGLLLMSSSPTLLAGHLLGNEAAGLVGVCMSLVYSSVGLMSAFLTMKTPSMAGMLARGELNEVLEDYRRGLRKVLALSLVFGSVLVVVGPTTVSLLTGQSLERFGFIRWVFLCSPALVTTTFIRQYSDAIDDRPRIAVSAIFGLVPLAGCLWLASWLQLTLPGPPLGWISLGFCVQTVFLAWSLDKFGESATQKSVGGGRVAVKSDVDRWSHPAMD